MEKHYVENLQNKDDTEKLLESDNPLVLSCALRAMIVQPVEIELLEKLKKFLTSEDYGVRRDAAAVIGKDPEVSDAKDNSISNN